MPVTITPSQNGLENVIPGSSFSNPEQALLSLGNEDIRNQYGGVLQSSFTGNATLNTDGSHPVVFRDVSPDQKSSLVDLSSSHISRPVLSHGLIGTALEAYSQHHHLVLRPDDIWISIICQFSFFVSGNAEDVRHHFVAHDEKKELIVQGIGNRFTVDFGRLSRQMAELAQKNVLDPQLKEWIMPKFSTTTATDEIVATVLMLSTLKEYFSYTFHLFCGLPAVTLLGEKSDWELLLTRIEKLPQYGEHTTQWFNVLKPVLSRFVESFDSPESPRITDFWNRIAHRQSLGSGPEYLTGWITAFAFFDADGKSLYKEPPEHGGLPSALELDGVKYYPLDTNDVPESYGSVPIKIDDNGELVNSTIVAGLPFSKVVDSSSVSREIAGEKDGIQPVSGWWMYEHKEENGVLAVSS